MELQETKSSPILHILVVGFHHKLGCQIEFSYPLMPCNNQGGSECLKHWKYLPTLALPDGSHKFVKDTVFFNLPSLTRPTESVYGVSCYRQVSTEKLKIRTVDVTRSTVQKSVCCLLSIPIYAYIEVKLSLITDSYFEQGDFSNIEILKQGYDQLSRCFLNADISSYRRHLYVGLPIREIVLNWKHKTLQLFKLFLLQKRVICFDSPVRDMCMLILGIVSLYPRLLENGFQQVACVRRQSKQNCSQEIKPNHNADRCTYLHPTNNILQISKLESNHGNEKTDDTPVSIFSNGHLCLPYFSLPYMDLLTDTSVCSYVVGTSNVLFQQKRHLSDVLIDIKNVNLEFNDPALKHLIVLTIEDLRFMDYILRCVQSPKENAEGSEQWVRDQFHNYLFALLHSMNSIDVMGKDTVYYNVSFVEAFKNTECFQNWSAVRPLKDIFVTTAVTHPFAGSLSVADMKLKFSQTLQNSDSGRKINQAVSSTSRAVGDVIVQAKDVVTNWWSSILTIPTVTAIPSNHCNTATEAHNNNSSSSEECTSQTNCVILKSNWEPKGLEVTILQTNNANHESNSGLQGIPEIGRNADVLYRSEYQ